MNCRAGAALWRDAPAAPVRALSGRTSCFPECRPDALAGRAALFAGEYADDNRGARGPRANLVPLRARRRGEDSRLCHATRLRHDGEGTIESSMYADVSRALVDPNHAGIPREMRAGSWRLAIAGAKHLPDKPYAPIANAHLTIE